MSRRAAGFLALALVAASCSSWPPEPTGPLRRSVDVEGSLEFVVIGDFGSGDPAQDAVAGAVRAWAAARPVDALATTGDNVYENGHPDAFDEAWQRPYGWVEEEGIEVVATLGNHDLRTAHGRPVMQLLGMPGPWYAVAMGPVEFVVLDGSHPDDPDQRGFLDEVLDDPHAPWQVILLHQPPYSCGTEHGSSPETRELVPVLRSGGADLVLSGHDHTYQRFPPIQGMTFVVSGGGGAELDGLGPCPPGTPRPAASFSDAHHFLYVEATDTELRIRAVRVSGAVADTVTLSR